MRRGEERSSLRQRTRRLEIARHLAYGEKRLPGVMRESALITAEMTVLGAA